MGIKFFNISFFAFMLNLLFFNINLILFKKITPKIYTILVNDVKKLLITK